MKIKHYNVPYEGNGYNQLLENMRAFYKALNLNGEGGKMALIYDGKISPQYTASARESVASHRQIPCGKPQPAMRLSECINFSALTN
jgi:hypothetical protein